MLMTLGRLFLKVLVFITAIVFRFILHCFADVGVARHRDLAQEWTLLCASSKWCSQTHYEIWYQSESTRKI